MGPRGRRRDPSLRRASAGGHPASTPAWVSCRVAGAARCGPSGVRAVPLPAPDGPCPQQQSETVALDGRGARQAPATARPPSSTAPRRARPQRPARPRSGPGLGRSAVWAPATRACTSAARGRDPDKRVRKDQRAPLLKAPSHGSGSALDASGRARGSTPALPGLEAGARLDWTIFSQSGRRRCNCWPATCQLNGYPARYPQPL